MNIKIKLFLLLIFSLNLFANDLDIDKIFKSENIEGTMILESLKKKETYIYNEKRAKKPYSPASTFKILNTLIALNEEIIKEYSVIVWDKKIRDYDFWNKNQTIKTAFKNSCVWCYQEFASKTGLEKYKKYLKELDYGNKILGDDVSSFWLDESLKITTFEQINFLKKLYKDDLPFKKEDINLVKKIMIDEENKEYIIRAKTGWTGKYGWYVGYIETKDDVWFFATNIDTKSNDDLAKRKTITLKALKLKGVIN